MPRWDEPKMRRRMLAALLALGFGLTLIVFYPGVMTFDARFVYEDIAKGTRGDWQSPVMTVLWALIDPLAPGPASMFLLIVFSYWLAFGLIASVIAKRSLLLAAALLVLAMLPPAFVFAGIIWRDVLFATTWLLAGALVFATSGQPSSRRMAAQTVAFGLLALGVLFRPNALIAAPVLLTYIVWPAQFHWKRLIIIALPAMLGCYALVQVIYYPVLGATRQNPLHSIMVFDLGGITHFTGENQFPVTWPPAENSLVLNGCYKPTEWDLYWRHDPCRFVMAKLEGDKIFGSPALTLAWRNAVMRHPLAYLRHRTAFLWNFLTGDNLTMWTYDVYNPPNQVFEHRAAFNALVAVHDALKPTPLFRVGTWLLLCIAVCFAAWWRRATPSGAFALGICGAAIVYVLTFWPVGVASDFRYGYVAVLAGLAGTVALVKRSDVSA